MRLVYFVHDLNDPAVARRVAMLKAGGIEVTLTGFWRGAIPRTTSNVEVFPLSQTFDSRLVHRAWTTLRHALTAGEMARRFKAADIFLARNLEMLATATAAARQMPNPPAIAYEVLDIHRTLLSAGVAGKVLRSVERALMRNVALLITSSSAFLKEYFEARQFTPHTLPALVVENKLFATVPARGSAGQIPPSRPWRIGWFGVIRCRRSMEILGALARRRPDLVQIEMRGRVAAPVRQNVEELRRGATAIHCGGLYRTAELADLYRRVHFNWTIDYFEAGGNSEWLLPNRLYEGGSFDVVPVALRRTETGRWLAKRKLGVLFDDAETQLEAFLETLNAEGYLALKSACSQAPRSLFVAAQGDCDGLAMALRRAAGMCAQSAPDTLYATA